MANAEIQVTAYFVVFFDADSKSEARQLHKQLEKALDGGKYLLPMLSEIHRCDYSNCVIEFNLRDVQKSDVGYYSPVDVEIHNKTRVNVDDDTDMNDMNDWFYGLDNLPMIKSLTYETMPDGCDADFDDMDADIFVD